MKRLLINYWKRTQIMQIAWLGGQLFCFLFLPDYKVVTSVVVIAVLEAICFTTYAIAYRGGRIDKFLELKDFNKMIKTEEHGPTLKKFILLNHDYENMEEIKVESEKT